MLIYVIAAYESAERVRDIHDRLRALGHTPTSRWAEQAHGPEELGDYAECEAIIHANLRDMRSADVVIILADTPMREGWCEVERCGPNAVVVGRYNLTTRARCYARVDSDDEAIAWVQEVAS